MRLSPVVNLLGQTQGSNRPPQKIDDLFMRRDLFDVPPSPNEVHHIWCRPARANDPFWFVVAARDEEARAWRESFGSCLRSLREQRAMSQEQLAEMAGVDRKLVYRTELGQTSPRLDAVVHTSRVRLGSASELLAVEGPRS